MPREISGGAEAQRRRQMRYRERLRARQCPETDAVDTAVADAVAALDAAVRISGRPGERLFGLVARAAVNLLVSRGYDREESIDRIRRRMGRQEAQNLIPAARGKMS